VRFATLYWAWWIAWTPLAGSYLATLAKGRTLREYVLGVFGIPLIIGIVSTLSPNALATLLSGIFAPLTKIDPFFVLVLLAISGAGVFFAMLKGRKDTGFFVNGFMPVKENMVRGRLWFHQGSKIVGIARTLPQLAMSCIGVLFLHTSLGWFGVQILLGGTAALMIFVLYYGLGSLALKSLTRRL